MSVTSQTRANPPWEKRKTNSDAISSYVLQDARNRGKLLTRSCRQPARNLGQVNHQKKFAEKNRCRKWKNQVHRRLSVGFQVAFDIKKTKGIVRWMAKTTTFPHLQTFQDTEIFCSKICVAQNGRQNAFQVMS